MVPAQEAVLCGERRVEKLLLRRVASDRLGAAGAVERARGRNSNTLRF